MNRRAGGRCHCGAVNISVPDPPKAVTECHCSICRRYGALWAYYPKAAVSFIGRTETYAWGRKRIDFHRCATCGCVVGWLPRGDYPECGVNARLLDGFDRTTVTLFVEEDASA